MAVQGQFDRNLITSPQSVTASWADLGNEIKMANFKSIAVFIDIDINDTQNFRFRALAKHSEGHADEFNFPIRATTPSQVSVEDEFLEFTNDVDQKIVLEVQTNYVIPYLQFQIQAGTPGGSPGAASAVTIQKSTENKR